MSSQCRGKPGRVEEIWNHLQRAQGFETQGQAGPKSVTFWPRPRENSRTARHKLRDRENF